MLRKVENFAFFGLILRELWHTIGAQTDEGLSLAANCLR
jgi:hypothetical protein